MAVGVLVLQYWRRTGGDMRTAHLLFMAWMAVLIIAVMAVGYIKGEPPRWRWGPKD